MGIARWAKALLGQLERALAHGTERIVCISHFERDSAARRGIRSDRLEVVYNGVADRPAGAAIPPFPGDRLNLLFIGRLDRQKGLDVAEAAMAALADFPVHLHVIGAGVLAARGAAGAAQRHLLRMADARRHPVLRRSVGRGDRAFALGGLRPCRDRGDASG